MTQKQTKLMVSALFVAAALMLTAFGSLAFSLGKYDKVQQQNGIVTIPASKLADGKAHFYKISEGGTEIAFFIVKAPDGSLRSAFDACDVCYREKKGYEQQGHQMLCKNCNKKFATTNIGPHTIGGCNPSYLPSHISGKNILINLSDIKTGARFF
jgi:uncharacterized membrane protein